MIAWVIVAVPLIVAGVLLVWAVCVDASHADDDDSLAWAEYVARRDTRPTGNCDVIYVGHCSECGDAREDFYTCRHGGSTTPIEAEGSKA